MPASRLILRLPLRPGNAAFAKRVRGFANRVAALPGFPVLPVAGLAGVLLMTLVGAFGTGAMPPAMRTAFWLLLIGWNIAKWQAWFAWRVRTPADWPRASMQGALLLNVPLPFEIVLALRLFGVSAPIPPTRIWVEALAISAAIFAVLLVARRRQADAPIPVATIRPGGLLAKAGVALPEALLAIRAEDHYCRLFLAGGREVLIHHRFGHALVEIAAFDGAQVHRGAWVADRGVVHAERAGRAWRLVLPSGAALPVSPRFVAAARSRGWLARAKTVAIAAARG